MRLVHIKSCVNKEFQRSFITPNIDTHCLDVENLSLIANPSRSRKQWRPLWRTSSHNELRVLDSAHKN